MEGLRYYRPRLHAFLAAILSLSLVYLIEVLLNHSETARMLYLLPVWVATRLGGRFVGTLVVVATTTVLATTDAFLGRYLGDRELSLDISLRFVTLTGLMLLVHQVEGTLQSAQRFASRDELTGVFNRRAFMDLAAISVENAKRNASELALVMVDCDNFKGVNDRYGHLQGDHVLRRLADVLQSESRAGDLVARLGGDEFVVLLANAGPYGVASFHLRIVDVFREAMREDGIEEVAISAGAAFLGRHGTSIEELLSHADGVMYELKAKSPYSPHKTVAS